MYYNTLLTSITIIDFYNIIYFLIFILYTIITNMAPRKAKIESAKTEKVDESEPIEVTKFKKVRLPVSKAKIVYARFDAEKENLDFLEKHGLKTSKSKLPDSENVIFKQKNMKKEPTDYNLFRDAVNGITYYLKP